MRNLGCVFLPGVLLLRMGNPAWAEAPAPEAVREWLPEGVTVRYAGIVVAPGERPSYLNLTRRGERVEAVVRSAIHGMVWRIPGRLSRWGESWGLELYGVDAATRVEVSISASREAPSVLVGSVTLGLDHVQEFYMERLDPGGRRAGAHGLNGGWQTVRRADGHLGEPDVNLYLSEDRALVTGSTQIDGRRLRFSGPVSQSRAEISLRDDAGREVGRLQLSRQGSRLFWSRRSASPAVKKLLPRRLVLEPYPIVD